MLSLYSQAFEDCIFLRRFQLQLAAAPLAREASAAGPEPGKLFVLPDAACGDDTTATGNAGSDGWNAGGGAGTT